MLRLTRAHIDAIRCSPELSASLADHLKGYGVNLALASKPSAELSDSDYLDLQDACSEAWWSDAPELRCYTGLGKNEYSILVKGIPGAYYVAALEFDDQGPFASLDEAIACAESTYGEDIARAAEPRED